MARVTTMAPKNSYSPTRSLSLAPLLTQLTMMKCDHSSICSSF